MEKFFTGWHQPCDVHHFARAFVSVERLWDRKSDFLVNDWVLDSGALKQHRLGKGHWPVKKYAAQVRRWKRCGNLLAAVCQDYMCEDLILKATGLNIQLHQILTLGRYDDLLGEDTGVYIMPVLQGYAPADYVRHLNMYGNRLTPGAWVGIGSVCKRNGSPMAVQRVLDAIKGVRPDLRLHGFGLKKTALAQWGVYSQLFSADSMASSFHERMAGRSANNWRSAFAYTQQIEKLAELGEPEMQWSLF